MGTSAAEYHKRRKQPSWSSTNTWKWKTSRAPCVRERPHVTPSVPTSKIPFGEDSWVSCTTIPLRPVTRPDSVALCPMQFKRKTKNSS